MSNREEIPLPVASSLRQVVGALIFGSNRDLSAEAIRDCLAGVAAEAGAEAALFGDVPLAAIREAALDIQKDLERLSLGFELSEVGGGYRLQTQAACGRWVRALLKTERPNRLSRPALETLAIIAYRQPIAKSEIEGIRGVAVDHIIKALMEMHLVRIVGRSDLPGRPFLYGTSASFLDHFGLKSLDELNEMDPTLQRSRPRERAALHRKPKPTPETAASDGGEQGAVGDDAAVPASPAAGAEPPPPEPGSALAEVLGPEKVPEGAEPVFEAPQEP